MRGCGPRTMSTQGSRQRSQSKWRRGRLRVLPSGRRAQPAMLLQDQDQLRRIRAAFSGVEDVDAVRAARWLHGEHEAELRRPRTLRGHVRTRVPRVVLERFANLGGGQRGRCRTRPRGPGDAGRSRIRPRSGGCREQAHLVGTGADCQVLSVEAQSCRLHGAGDTLEVEAHVDVAQISCRGRPRGEQDPAAP